MLTGYLHLPVTDPTHHRRIFVRTHTYIEAATCQFAPVLESRACGFRVLYASTYTVALP